MQGQKPYLGTLLNISHPMSRGVIGCWMFNEGGGERVNDVSGHQHQGTIITPTWVGGKNGPALDTTIVNHHVDTGESALYNQAEFTVVAYVKLANSSSGQVRDDIVCKEGANSGWMLRWDETTNKFEMVSQTAGAWQVATANVTSVQDKWYHLVGRYGSANSTTISIDGIWRDSDSGGAYTGNASNVWIGANPDIADRMFFGHIDHVIIWNRHLSDYEIYYLAHHPFCMFEQEPIELWSAATQGAGAGGMNMPLLMQQMNHFGGGAAA